VYHPLYPVVQIFHAAEQMFVAISLTKYCHCWQESANCNSWENYYLTFSNCLEDTCIN